VQGSPSPGQRRQRQQSAHPAAAPTRLARPRSSSHLNTGKDVSFETMFLTRRTKIAHASTSTGPRVRPFRRPIVPAAAPTFREPPCMSCRSDLYLAAAAIGKSFTSHSRLGVSLDFTFLSGRGPTNCHLTGMRHAKTTLPSRLHNDECFQKRAAPDCDMTPQGCRCQFGDSCRSSGRQRAVARDGWHSW